MDIAGNAEAESDAAAQVEFEFTVAGVTTALRGMDGLGTPQPDHAAQPRALTALITSRALWLRVSKVSYSSAELNWLSSRALAAGQVQARGES